VSLEESVQAIVGAVEREGLRDVVLVGHGFAGLLLLQAAGQLPHPPKRLVLIAGIVPDNQQSMLSVFPQRTRKAFRLLEALSSVARQDLRLPRWVIANYLCNGIDPMEVVHILGSFGPLPTRVLTTSPPKADASELKTPCPVTYVVLTQDRVLPPQIQHRMAGRIPDVEVLQLDSCHQVTLAKPRELADLLLRYA
jgi:pimeloyl-ACP methyl ester carboxylesterase